MSSLNITLSAPARGENPYKTILVSNLYQNVYADGFKVYGGRISGALNSDIWQLVCGWIWLQNGVIVADRKIKAHHMQNKIRTNTLQPISGAETEAIAATESGSLGIGDTGPNFGSGAYATTDPKNGFWQIGSNVILQEKDAIVGWVYNFSNGDSLDAQLTFKYLNWEWS